MYILSASTYGANMLKTNQARNRRCLAIYLENHFVWLVKYDFKPRFNIVKYKYVKEFHFGMFLLAK